MPSSERLLAWIEHREQDCLAAFVAESAVRRRKPATRRCGTEAEARQWVMNEAEAVHAAVQWVAPAMLTEVVGEPAGCH